MAIPITSDINTNLEDVRNILIHKSIDYEKTIHNIELEKSHL